MLDTPATRGMDTDQSMTGAPAETLPMTANGLCFSRGQRKIIDGINLTLKASQLSVIMGPNGAGKSVLLRLLHGLLKPSAGKICWGQTSDAEVARRHQAMVFQKPVLLRRSVRANLDFILTLRGPADPVRRDSLLEEVGLLAQASQPARQLSGGEQQRLALARALATNPSILFLDEPSASLDPASALMIEQQVINATKRGIKCIFVTHDIGQATRLADEIVFLHHGVIQEQTDAQVFFRNPTSEAAMAYLDGRILL